jgi:hypothetical protein
VPDLVIFYDGVNDVYAAYESGLPGVHVTLADVAAKFEEPEHPLVKWFKTSRQFALFERLVDKAKPGRSGNGQALSPDTESDNDIDQLANSVTNIYLSNHKIVSALAQEYSFEYAFFWQPHLAVGGKALTREEQVLKSRMDPALAKLTKAVYGDITSEAADRENLWDIAYLFDEEDRQIWIDDWGHVTPEGNRLVAQEMLTAIESELAEE